MQLYPHNVCCKASGALSFTRGEGSRGDDDSTFAGRDKPHSAVYTCASATGTMA